MDKREILEIRKQLHPAVGCYQTIAGCFVNQDREVASIFQKHLSSLSEDELFRYMEIFRKGLGGTLGKTLLNMEFPTKECLLKQSLLLQLKNSKLQDEESFESFAASVAESYAGNAPYMLLMLYGLYDVPGKSTSNAGNLNDAELGYESDYIYEHILGCICPVELDKVSLAYDTEKPDIQDHIREWLIKMPDKAFLYPAFTDRQENIHQMLYYTKKSMDIMPGFLDEVFGVEYLATAEQQQEAFAKGIEVVGASFENVVKLKKAVEGLRCEEANDIKIDANTLTKLCDSCGINGKDVKTVMETDGVKEMMTGNLFQNRKTVVKTDDVSIQLPTELLDLIEVHEINGAKCLVIRPNGNVKIDDIGVRL